MWRAVMNHRLVNWIRGLVREDASGEARDYFLNLQVFAARQNIVIDEDVVSPAGKTAHVPTTWDHGNWTIRSWMLRDVYRRGRLYNAHAPELNLVLEISKQTSYPGCQVYDVGWTNPLEVCSCGGCITQVAVAAALCASDAVRSCQWINRGESRHKPRSKDPLLRCSLPSGRLFGLDHRPDGTPDKA